MSEELILLKERATQMGIAYSPNIGISALKAKIDAKLADDQAGTAGEDVGDSEEGTATATKPAAKPLTEQEIRKKQFAEQLALVRLRITNLNPAKKDLQGEIITVANRYVGTVRKFVPYGEASDAGYHVPRIIYNELKDRKFNSIKVIKAKNGAQEYVEQRLVNEFALEVLPALTQKELDELARKQAAAEGMA